MARSPPSPDQCPMSMSTAPWQGLHLHLTSAHVNSIKARSPPSPDQCPMSMSTASWQGLHHHLTSAHVNSTMARSPPSPDQCPCQQHQGKVSTFTGHHVYVNGTTSMFTAPSHMHINSAKARSDVNSVKTRPPRSPALYIISILTISKQDLHVHLHSMLYPC